MYRFIQYLIKIETNYYHNNSLHTQNTEIDAIGNILTITYKYLRPLNEHNHYRPLRI